MPPKKKAAALGSQYVNKVESGPATSGVGAGNGLLGASNISTASKAAAVANDCTEFCPNISSAERINENRASKKSDNGVNLVVSAR